MFGRLFALGCVLAATATMAIAGDNVPAWLQQAAAANVPSYEKDVTAVVLLNEQEVLVNSDGKLTVTRTYAVRILVREGRSNAVAAVPYLTGSGKVKDFHAWLIKPAGEVKRFGKDEVFDVISDPNDIYNELRVKTVSAKEAADAGAVFGYQAVSEERSIFGEDSFNFQNRLPALVARYTTTLPAGWNVHYLTFNHAKIEPQMAGATYTWELHNLAPIKKEPASPEFTNLAPRLVVSYVTPEGASSSLKTFATWSEVSRFVSELHDPQATPDEALALKARELTAGARTELERIKAIGRYVQRLQYISIDIGVGHGGGIRPHAAAEVFSKSYGDCKDKANLMRAMLKAVQIDSYPVAIYLGDRDYVREEWASPGQFNHCIIAIKVSDETKLATVIQHPKLGRLLIFDSTDEDTPVGDLPDQEQGSWALLVAKDEGALLRMPITPPEANRMEREAEMTLSPDGSMVATIREKSMGQSAVDERRMFRHLTRPEYTRAIEGWITRGATGAKLSKAEPADDDSEGRFALDVEFAVRDYAQLMQGRLMVFKPAIVSRLESLSLTDPTRQHPVVLDSSAFGETVRVKLPAGFQVDEMPDPLKLDTAFGTYATSYKVNDNQLVFTRTLTLRAATIPAAQYDSVRKFFASIRAAEQAPVVLAKK